MHPLLFLAALCLGIASAAPQGDPNLDAQWFQWKAAHGKIYNVDEEGWRRAVWETNLKMIEQHNREYNQGKHSFMMAMNDFGDMKTNGEFRHTVNGLKIQKGKNRKVFQIPMFAGISVPVDKRQTANGQCGSCWAFSATGALEGQMFWKTGKFIALRKKQGTFDVIE